MIDDIEDRLTPTMPVPPPDSEEEMDLPDAMRAIHEHSTGHPGASSPELEAMRKEERPPPWVDQVLDSVKTLLDDQERRVREIIESHTREEEKHHVDLQSQVYATVERALGAHERRMEGFVEDLFQKISVKLGVK